jgi:hypothetical protein
MVRGRKWSVAGKTCLLAWALFGTAFAAGAEVREEELFARSDVSYQIDELSRLGREIRAKQIKPVVKAPLLRPVPPKPMQSEAEFVDLDTSDRAVTPLLPGTPFNPRVLGSKGGASPQDPPWARPDPAREGVVGAPKVKFGDRKDVSLATIAQNNQTAVEAIAEAAVEPPFVNPGSETAEEPPPEKTFEERLEIFSEKETPFSVQDYVEFRDFSAQFEEELWQLPNRDTRFHENLRLLYRQFADKDANRKAGEPMRRLLGVEEGGRAKGDTSKKRSKQAGRTH